MARTGNSSHSGGGCEDTEDRPHHRHPRAGARQPARSARAPTSRPWQHPHDPHRPHLTSALDFWPALFGIEIYGVDAELRRALHGVVGVDDDDDGEENEEEEEEEDGDGRLYPDYEDQDEDYDDKDGESGGRSTSHTRARARTRTRARRDRAYAARDEVRREAREAALRVAARMDGVMEAAAFGKHREMLRLRAQLALFVGDLAVPWRLVRAAATAVAQQQQRSGGGGMWWWRGMVGRSEEDEGDENEEEGEEDDGSPLAAVDALLARAAADPTERAAVAARRAEHARARGFFARLAEVGGADALGEEWVRRFVEAEDDEEEGEEQGGLHGWF